MEHKQWKYKVGGNLRGMTLFFILLAVFSGANIWLYSRKNGAFFFTALFSFLILMMIAYIIYRSVFVKVLIGEHGFFHQTKPGNGKHFDYSEILEAWKSSGMKRNGTIAQYCSYRTIDGKVTKFPFLMSESDAVNYFLARSNGVNNEAERQQINNTQWDYVINGKPYGKGRIVMFFVFSVFFAFMTMIPLRDKPDGFIVPVLLLGSITLLFLFGSIFSFVQYCYLKVHIENTGFYYQSSPFNKKYYAYSDIANCKEELIISKLRHGKDHCYFFYFTEKGGKTTHFLFEKSVYEYEINELKNRIASKGS